MRISPLVPVGLALLVCSSCSAPADTSTQEIGKLEQKIQTLESEIAHLKQAGERKQPNSMRVLVVSAEQIPAYEPLRDEMFEFIEVAESELLSDAVTSREDYEDKDLNTELTRGELLTRSRLINAHRLTDPTPEEIAAVEEKLKGKRVFTMPLVMLPQQQKRVRPSSVVDVYANYPVKGIQTAEIYQTDTELVLSDVEVFAIGKDRVLPRSELDVAITLLVDSVEQAEKLQAAQKKGFLLLDVKR